MKRYQLFFLNLFCATAIFLISFFSWQYLTIETAYIRSDCSIFYRTLRAHDPMYRTYYFVYPEKLNSNSKKYFLQKIKPMPAINLDTPTMNFFLKALLTFSNDSFVLMSVWIILSLSFLGAAMMMLMKCLDSTKIKWCYFLLAIVLVWLSWPSIYAQIGGEVSFFIFPFLALAFLLAINEEWIPMTVLLGFIASIKIFFLLFILWFWMRREWRLLLLFIMSFLAFFFLPLIVFSWRDYLDFFQLAQSYRIFIAYSGIPWNGALLSFFVMLVYYLKLVVSITQLRLIVSLFSLCILVSWVIYYRQYIESLSNYRAEIGFSFIIILALIISPLAWVYYYIFLSIPVVTLLKINQRYHFSAIFYVCFAIALYLPFLAWLNASEFVAQSIRHFSAFLDLLFWLVCMHIGVRTVSRGVVIQSAPQKTGYFLLFVNVVLTVIFLSFGIGSLDYLRFNTDAYKRDFTPGIWIHVGDSKSEQKN